MFYKMVRRVDDTATSVLEEIPVGALVSGGIPESCHRVIYSPGEWVEPPHGPSFVFAELEDAILHWIDWSTSTCQLWACEVEDEREISWMIAPGLLCNVSSALMIRYWEGKTQLSERIVMKGTWVARRIKLVKRVDQELEL